MDKNTLGARFTGKIAMVTGGGQGIGRSVALRFAKEGADIAVVDYHLVTAQGVAKEVITLGRKALAVKADMSKEDEVNQLGSSFPRIETKVFLQNYSGGVRAIYMGDGFDFEKSKSHLEHYKAEIIREEHWKGIKFNYESEKQEQLKGLPGSISYLTLPNSNVIKIRREFTNPTSARFEFYNYLWISPNVGGNIEKNELVFPRDERILRLKRGDGAVVSGVNPERGWAFVANKNQKTGLGIIAGNPDKSMLLSIDIGKSLMELMIQSKVQMQPTESCKLEDYIVLTNEDHEQMDKMSNILREAS